MAHLTLVHSNSAQTGIAAIEPLQMTTSWETIRQNQLFAGLSKKEFDWVKQHMVKA